MSLLIPNYQVNEEFINILHVYDRAVSIKVNRLAVHSAIASSCIVYI